uniref:Uncharacterized protein n=1 Tax=Poecilia formosa TaxID=48698 RepID=A0A096M5I1_POEFO
MDLVSWSLNAIDTGKQGKGELSYPDGTFFAEYTMDSTWKWETGCLTMLSVEDVEDVYMIGFMITGFLLKGVGGYLGHWKFWKIPAAVLATSRLPGMVDGICRAINTQTEMTRELSHRLGAILEQDRGRAADLELRMDMTITDKSRASVRVHGLTH